MLNEIICDKFKKNNQRIVFNKGLNVVLGNDQATNSIGKSTFLMIIDFAFGGDDYINKLDDVQRNVKSHVIKFSFSFDGNKFFFARNTDSPATVSYCDSKYKTLSEESITEFRAFLKEHYELDSLDLSFRDTVSLFFRIYGRDTANEIYPLQSYNGEKEENSVLRLIKLYKMYESISELEELQKKEGEKLSAFKNSVKYGYIDIVNKHQSEKNKKEILEKNKEIDDLAKAINTNTADIESMKTSVVLELKNSIKKLKIRLAHYEAQRKSLIDQLDNSPSISKVEKSFYSSLKEFFPNIETNKIEDVNLFHKTLVKVLNSEIQIKIDDLEALITQCHLEIDALLKQLSEFEDEKDLSTVILKKVSTVVNEKGKLISETENYDKKNRLIENEKIAKERLEKEIGVITTNLQILINMELEQLNKNLYKEEQKAPSLILNMKSYQYHTFDDKGTGTNYKNLILLDLCILKQTALPTLIHDSMLFKNIADEPLQNIFKQYNESNKQIFIAFDRQNTYSSETQTLLDDAKVLQLDADNEALFGFTWNKK